MFYQWQRQFFENGTAAFESKQRQGQAQMVGPSGFENKLHRPSMLFGRLEQLPISGLIIVELRWQSQWRSIDVEPVFADINCTVE